MQFQVKKLNIPPCSRHELRRLQSCEGESLAREMMARVLGKSPDSLDIRRHQNGKPYLVGNALYFSISHSGPFVMCALHTAPVGADIEMSGAYRERIAKRICSPAEYAYIQGDATRFLQVWTRKEAFVKLSGKGISFGLKKIPTADQNGLTPDILSYAVSTQDTEQYVCSVVWDITETNTI